eukprot:2108824-Amphidinium_carterae.4
MSRSAMAVKSRDNGTGNCKNWSKWGASSAKTLSIAMSIATWYVRTKRQEDSGSPCNMPLLVSSVVHGCSLCMDGVRRHM